MSAVSQKLRRWAGSGQAGYSYWCQGCNELHGVRTEGQSVWGFNGNVDAPTFTPSVLTTWTDHSTSPPTEHRCHTFITNGSVRFLDDCTHALAGKTEPLPDLPDWLRG